MNCWTQLRGLILMVFRLKKGPSLLLAVIGSSPYHDPVDAAAPAIESQCHDKLHASQLLFRALIESASSVLAILLLCVSV